MSLRETYNTAYEGQARRRDAGLPHVRPALAGQRAVQDTVLEERHVGFDLSAQDTHMKYERKQFAVVGEGTKQANDAYRNNYDKIDWRK